MALSPSDFIDLDRMYIVCEYKSDFYFLFNCLDIDCTEENLEMVEKVVNYLMLKAGKNLCYVELPIC